MERKSNLKRCHICDALAVETVPGYQMFHRVTSDCKPWPRGGQLGVCQACGCVQKAIDHVWHREIEQIYAAYSIYHQSDGNEQVIFDRVSGRSSPRSTRLLEHLQARITLPEQGRLLDVGCGNGALLRSFSALMPSWSLVGTELNDRYRAIVEDIQGVEGFYTCMPELVPGRFNLITMIHVLEHIPAPAEFLSKLWSKLEPDGYLVIEVPDCLQNPFDLLIADHCTHFTASTITELLRSAGFEIALAAADWIPKELTIVGTKTGQQRTSPQQRSTPSPLDVTVKSLQWLESVLATARELSTKGNFGLFGTSIAATWLFGELEGRVDFFVDEDLQRVGRTHMERPIYHPSEVPAGSCVFIALPPKLAESIQARMQRAKFGFDCHVPIPW